MSGAPRRTAEGSGSRRAGRRRCSPPLVTGGPPLPLLAVHYVGRLASTGEVFMDTREESQTEEPEEVVAGRGEWSDPCLAPPFPPPAAAALPGCFASVSALAPAHGAAESSVLHAAQAQPN